MWPRGGGLTFVIANEVWAIVNLNANANQIKGHSEIFFDATTSLMLITISQLRK